MTWPNRQDIKILFFCGDLNADPRTREGKKLDYLTRSNNMQLHINCPTRITPTTATILDQFVSNCPELISDIEVIDPISTCDYCPITASLKFKNNFAKKAAYSRHIWQYDKVDFSAFREALLTADWDACFESDDPSVVATLWTETFMMIARTHIPNKSIIVRPNDKSFFNANLRRLRRQKNRKHKAAKLLNTPESWQEFREIRNKYNDKLNEMKKGKEAKQLNLLKDPDNLNTKQWWNIASSILNRQKSSSYPPLVVGNEIVTGSKEKAEMFNEYFTSFATLDSSNVQLPISNEDQYNILSNIEITESEVRDLIHCMDTGKASGPDQVPPMLLKQAGSCIVPSLTRLFNLSLSKHIFPRNWKKANVLPIFKKTPR